MKWYLLCHRQFATFVCPFISKLEGTAPNYVLSVLTGKLCSFCYSWWLKIVLQSPVPNGRNLNKFGSQSMAKISLAVHMASKSTNFLMHYLSQRCRLHSIGSSHTPHFGIHQAGWNLTSVIVSWLTACQRVKLNITTPSKLILCNSKCGYHHLIYIIFTGSVYHNVAA